MDNVVEEIMDIIEPLFTICIDDNGYYTSDNTENLVSIKTMPIVEDVKHLFAYRYNPDTEELQLDEEKLAEINNEVANTPMEISPEERLIALENAFMELTAMTLGGGVNG
jgi:hypothetical protein